MFVGLSFDHWEKQPSIDGLKACVMAASTTRESQHCIAKLGNTRASPVPSLSSSSARSSPGKATASQSQAAPHSFQHLAIPPNLPTKPQRKSCKMPGMLGKKFPTPVGAYRPAQWMRTRGKEEPETDTLRSETHVALLHRRYVSLTSLNRCARAALGRAGCTGGIATDRCTGVIIFYGIASFAGKLAASTSRPPLLPIEYERQN